MMVPTKSPGVTTLDIHYRFKQLEAGLVTRLRGKPRALAISNAMALESTSWKATVEQASP